MGSVWNEDCEVGSLPSRLSFFDEPNLAVSHPIEKHKIMQ